MSRVESAWSRSFRREPHPYSNHSQRTPNPGDIVRTHIDSEHGRVVKCDYHHNSRRGTYAFYVLIVWADGSASEHHPSKLDLIYAAR